MVMPVLHMPLSASGSALCLQALVVDEVGDGTEAEGACEAEGGCEDDDGSEEDDESDVDDV